MAKLGNSSSSAVASKPRERRLCKACGEVISSGAVRCKHCSSYQDWRRYLRWIIVAASTGTAIITFVVANTPLVENLTTPSGGDLNFRYQCCPGRTISAVVENRGRRPATLGGLTLEVRQPGQGQAHTYLKPVGLQFTTSQVIAAKSTQVIDFEWERADKWLFAGSLSQCFLTYHWQDDKGRDRESNETIPCSDLLIFTIVSGHWYQDGRRPPRVEPGVVEQ